MRPKIAVFALLGIGILAAGYFARLRAVSAAPASKRRPAAYTCPMHPQFHSDRPGDCPACGMRLVPADGAETAPTTNPARAVEVDARRQQLIGVRTDEVRKAAGTYLLHFFGRVGADEDRECRIMAGADGWIRELGSNSAGVFVKKDDALGSYYTPNLVSATQTFVFAMQTNAQAQNGDAAIGYQRGTTALSLQVALDTLRSLGMSEFQIEEIRRTRVAPDRIRIYSPIDGVVVARNVSPQQRFDKGAELYRIADLRRVWVLASVHEQDQQYIKPGAPATVRYGGRSFSARMSATLPQFDVQSGALKARFELENPGYALRPDMFVDVDLEVATPVAVVVPAGAVMDSGLRKIVYIDRGNGMFEPRTIETGWRFGDRLQVTKGLEPGERIVVEGNFLIDSESRLQASAN